MDAHGNTKRPWQHLYSAKWRRARNAFLLENPICATHLQMEVLVEATVVDHIKPHKGNADLFWDMENWQSLCKQCHDSHKQAQERTGHVRGCDADGTPIDPNHHWNAGRAS